MTEKIKKRQFIKTSHIIAKNSPDGFDKISIIYKDEDGVKHNTFIENPKLSFYVTKPEFYTGEAVNYIEKDKVNRINCIYKFRNAEIKKALNDAKLNYQYENLMNSGSREGYQMAIQLLNTHPRVHNSDINLEDQYIAAYFNKYEPNANFVDLRKGFIDIEVDSTELDGKFPDPEEAEAPVNMVTFVDSFNKISYSYVLKYDTETYKETMSKKQELIDWLQERYKDDGLTFIIEEFDSELEVIAKTLETINEISRPDFMGAWNMDFDFATMFNRLRKLGQDPNNFFSPKDFAYKNNYYKLDTKSTDPSEKSSFFATTSYTTWIDQLATYANINKPKGRLDSYSLDFIANLELNEGKDDYEGDIANAFLVDYRKFLIYNIQDTILCHKIEDKIKHFDLLYQMSTMTGTRPTHVMKKTVSLRNFAMKLYEENGYILSNNRSSTFPKTGEKIPGGFVGDPNYIDHVGMELISGLSKFIHSDVVDEDFAALYPSLTELYNISPETHAGKITYTNDYGEDDTVKFIDAYVSGDNISFGVDYMGLPDVEDLVEALNQAKPQKAGDL